MAGEGLEGREGRVPDENGARGFLNNVVGPLAQAVADRGVRNHSSGPSAGTANIFLAAVQRGTRLSTRHWPAVCDLVPGT